MPTMDEIDDETLEQLALEDMVKSKEAAPSMTTLPLDVYREATSSRRAKTMASDIGRAISGGIESMTGAKADTGLYEGLRKSAEGDLKDLQGAQALEGDRRKSDPASAENIRFRTTMKALLPDVPLSDNMTLKDYEQNKDLIKFYAQQKLYDKKMDWDVKKFGAQQTATRAENDRKESKISDKQVGDISDFDQAIAKTEDAMGSLGGNKNWVGPLDGKVPDLMVGGDQVAFRAKIGRIADAYRKLITGAGASVKELQRLESRLPSENDTYENFISKAKDYVNEVKRSKGTYLETLKKQGKKVDEFASNPSVASPSSLPPEKEARYQELLRKKEEGTLK